VINDLIKKQLNLLVFAYIFVVSVFPYLYSYFHVDLSKLIILLIVCLALPRAFLLLALTKNNRLHYKHLFLIIAFTIAYSSLILDKPINDVLKESYLFLAFSLLIQDEYFNTNNKWITALSYGGAFSGIAALITYLKLIPVDRTSLVLYEKFNNDRTASFIDGNIGVLGVITSLFLLLERKDRKIPSFLCLCLSFANVLLGEFRTYVFASIFMCVVFMLVSKTKVALKMRIIILILLIGTFFVTLDPAERFSSFFMRVNHITNGSNSAAYRLAELEYESKLIENAPVLGNGWGIYTEHYIANNLPEYGHNMYLSWMARIGIPLTVIIVFSYFMILKRNYYLYKKDKNPNLYLLSITSIIGFLAICILLDVTKMSVSFPLYALLWNIRSTKI